MDKMTISDTSSRLAALEARIESREARIGIIGMGYVGLPLALLFSDRRFRVTGFDIEPEHSDYDTLRDIFLDYYARNICVHTQLFGDTAELVAELEQRGIKWGIVTNKPHLFTVPLMQALGYADRAACLISGDTCAHAKPHPEPMLKACEIIGVTPAHCLYLGDDLRDMQAANASGMRGIIANYGYVSGDASVENWNAHGSIDSPSHLLRYLQ